MHRTITASLTIALLCSAAAVSPILAAEGFSIAVDGATIAGDEPSEAPSTSSIGNVAEPAEAVDLALDAVDVQVKFDGLGARPVLNATTVESAASAIRGDLVRFRGAANYPAFITRSEIQVVTGGLRGDVFTVPLSDPNADAEWRVPVDLPPGSTYVLRVYDADGRFDETVPLPIGGAGAFDSNGATDGAADGPLAVSNGTIDLTVDRTARRSIPVSGGAVTVYGRQVPASARVDVLGEIAKVDGAGNFVVQRILPAGAHAVDVVVVPSGHREAALDITREISIPRSEWFAMGIADATLGRRIGGNSPEDRNWSRGRLAFYTKGRLQGGYTVTAAADTREEELQRLFRDFDSKDPRSFLRRLDPDRYYPVYGDDATTIEDAPTQGRFYAKVERGNSHLIWGNSKATMTGNEYARNERTLYGAHGKYVSPAVTGHGEARVTLEGYASQPDTATQRDRLRGTGGSVYLLSRQDISRGSETLIVEVRDPVSRVVRSRDVLRYGEDYEINYVQGVVILKRPLASTLRSGSVVTGNPLGDDAIDLVAQYEFTPATRDVDGMSYGGRAEAWVNDTVRVGVTGMKEKAGVQGTDGADQNVVGADLRLRLSEASHVQFDYARSRGSGVSSASSINGGLTLTDGLGVARLGQEADAYSVRLSLDLAELKINPQGGSLEGYYTKREAGFSAIGYQTAVRERAAGIVLETPVTDRVTVRAAYEDYANGRSEARRRGEIDVKTALTEQVSVEAGARVARYEGVSTLGGADPLADGTRADLGIRLNYAPQPGEAYYVFGQGTVSHSGGLSRNDRIGLGFERQLTDSLSANGEVSYGTLGWAALAGLGYQKDENTRYTLGYRLSALDPYRNLGRLGATGGAFSRDGLVMSARHRYNEAATVFSEIGYDRWSEEPSLNSTYGVELSPWEKLRLIGSFEYGDVEDRAGVSLQRTAFSLGASYVDDEAVSWHLRGEGRFEDSGAFGRDRTTWLGSSKVLMKISDDWRFITAFDGLVSRSDQADFLDGDFIEGSVGFAYRPVDNDRLNMLARYSYLYDLPGPDQVTAAGTRLGAAQRSHIISIDGTYDVNRWLSIGAKYGFRTGEVSRTRAADDFTSSTAHLGVIRADVHVVRNWDVFAEVRALHTSELDTTRTGAAVGVWRHVGDNLKVGAGYSFAEFSDNVADLNEDDHGVFVNITGKF